MSIYIEDIHKEEKAEINKHSSRLGHAFIREIYGGGSCQICMLQFCPLSSNVLFGPHSLMLFSQI